MSSAAYMQEYRRKNREKLNAHRREWMKKNPGKHGQYSAAWRAKNPEKASAHAKLCVQKRRALKLGQFVEDVDLEILLKMYKGLCGICGRLLAKGKKIHVDHIVPLSKGGKHSYENTQPSHARCNLQKGAKEIDKKEVLKRQREISTNKDFTEFRLAKPKRARRARKARSK